jgi:threonyl-tRNA synthetase
MEGNQPIPAGDDAANILRIRATLAHLLAATLLERHPSAKLGVCATTDVGFHVDVQLDQPLSQDQLHEVMEALRGLIGRRPRIQREAVSVERARQMFLDLDQPFKAEIVAEIAMSGRANADLVRIGEWEDIAAGPVVEDVRQIPLDGCRLDSVSGAYWKGSDANPVLTRIAGLAFVDRDALGAFEVEREAAAQRDHRRIGRDLDIFLISEEVGKGLPILLEKGNTIYRTLERFIVDEEIRRGYEHVMSPVIGRKWLYETSGHLGHYSDTMYPPMKVGEEEYILRPMTCPHHFMIFASRPRSYRELPLRIAEISPLFRKEHSGALSGLIRVLTFHLADAHIFIEPRQLKRVFKEVVDLIDYVMKCLGIHEHCSYRVSLRDENSDKYIDDPENWRLSEAGLIEIADELKLDYKIGKGEAAFYGPKLDVQMRTAGGREETLFTNQIDLEMSQRFNLSYITEDGSQQRPWIIHRSSLGCLERTIAFLLEHYSGALPTWLSPVQITVLPITNEQLDYAHQVRERFSRRGIRASLDDRNETLSRKVRDAQLQKVPYIAVVGKKEVQAGSLSVRNRDNNKTESIGLDEFLARVEAEIGERRTHLEAAAATVPAAQ